MITGLIATRVTLGVFTYNVVDYDKYVHQLGRAADNSTDSDDSPVVEIVPLRMMFVGASITRGEVSTGDRGYRKHIRDTVISWGRVVNFVGFNRFGDWEVRNPRHHFLLVLAVFKAIGFLLGPR